MKGGGIINIKKQRIALTIIIVMLSCQLAGCSALTEFVGSWGKLSPETTALSEEVTTGETPPPPETDPTEAPAYVATGKPSIDGGATLLQDKGSSEKKGEDFVSTTENKSAVKCINGGKVELSDLQVSTSGSTTSQIETSYYGLNSAVLVQNSGEAVLKKCILTTKGTGAAGIFAMGKGASVSLADTTISTEGLLSRGLMATYDSSIFAVTAGIKTAGDNSPAIATGYGGGTISVTGGTAETGGISSPAVYSTGVIALTGVSASAVNSEAAVLDGKSTLLMTGGKLSSLGINAIKFFDSGLGGTPKGESSFKMIGGDISSAAGAVFYVTNATSRIELQDVNIKNDTTTLLSAAAASGTSPNLGIGADKGGGNATLIASAQNLSGNVYCDNVSTVDFRMQAGTAYSGSINGENTGKEVRVFLDSTSTWTLTGTSYVTSFSTKLASFKNIKDGGHDIFYDSGDRANKSYEGKTFALPEGGRFLPTPKAGETAPEATSPRETTPAVSTETTPATASMETTAAVGSTEPAPNI